MSLSSSCSSDSDSEDTCSLWNLEDYTSSLDESSDSEEKPEDDQKVILIFYETLLLNLMGKFSVTDFQVTSSIKHLIDNYRQVSCGRLPSEIDYNDIKYCLGYLHRYAPCHTFLVAEVVSTILLESSVLNDLLNKQTLNVVFLGGGPGNDFVGFLMAFHGKHEEIFDLDVTIVDKMSGWENVFNETILQLRQEACGKAGYVFDDVNVSSTFITADLKETGEWSDEMKTKLRNADVVFLVKALSHIPDEDKLNVIQRYRTLNCNKTTMYYSIDMNFFYSKDNLVALHFKYDQARRRFVEWAQNEIAVVPDFHKRILFSDEAHFWLNGYVNKQNCRIWSEVNGDRYRALITNFFIPELNNHDVQELWFEQDGATCHTARATIDLLKDTLGDRLISRFGSVNWPPRSCDLTPLDYFLWGYFKSLVYADEPQTLDHLEDNIRRVTADIRPQMLEKVIENWTSRLDYIQASRFSPMPEIIF
ncbi:uncharacterized protein TNCV_1809351 [Trichonephila clavipes]|nr:uncharacterized protein TNCV_1809351 [Trichonephila clavipes]